MKYSLVIITTVLSGWAGWHGGSHSRQSHPQSDSGSVIGNVASASELPSGVRDLLETTETDYPTLLREAVANGTRDKISWLAQAWAAHDPAGLFEFMIAPDGLDFRGAGRKDDAIISACFETWFKQDFSAAMRAVDRFETIDPNDPSSKGRDLDPIMWVLIKIKPEAVIKYVGEHPDSYISPPLDFATLRTLTEHVLDFPPCNSRPIFLSNIYESLTEGNRSGSESAAIAWLAKLSPTLRMEAMPDVEFSEFADSSKIPLLKKIFGSCFTPEELATLAAETKGSQRTKTLTTIAQLHAMQDPTRAVNWAMDSLKGLEQHGAMMEILTLAAPAAPAEATQFIANIPEGPLRENVVSRIAQKMSWNGAHQAAAEWVLGLPEGTQTQFPFESPLDSVIQHWGGSNKPKECIDWIKQLPDGPIALKAAKSLLRTRDANNVLQLATKLPESLALAALKENWSGTSYHSLPLAEAAVRIPPGPIREAAIADASRDFGSQGSERYNQAWLDWASKLPTPEDRAAALKGAESRGTQTFRWAEGIREAAQKKLGVQ